MAAFRFFQKHLGGASEQVRDVEGKPLPGKELRVFPEDRDLPADSRNARIDESFVSAGKPSLPGKDELAEWKDGLLARLREALLDYFVGENRFGSSEESWRRYFYYFAFAARSSAPENPA